MSFVLHTEAEKNFNKAAYDLVGVIEEKEIVKKAPSVLKGSWKDKKTKDWTGKMADIPLLGSATNDFKRFDRYSEYGGIKTGLSEEYYLNFEKLVKGIHKKKEVSDLVNYEFIYDQTFDWIITTYKNKKAESDLIAFLQSKVLQSIGSYRFYFKVLNLDIEKEFKLGDVLFTWATPDFFDKVENRKDSLIDRFQGSVFASYELNNVVKDHGVQIAEKECMKAINVLKLFSPTVKVPYYTTTFDIDSRVSVYRENQYIVQDINNEKEMFINFRANGKLNEFDEATIDSLVECSANFVKLISLKEPNELQRLTLKALQKFSEGISTKDLHRRLVDLFTLQESLLLKNDAVNSRDSLIFFGGTLFRDPAESPDDFSKRIMRLYDIRSLIVHHDSKKEINLQDLMILQHQCISLMETCINVSFVLSDKLTFLADMERAKGMTIEQFTKERENK